MATDYDSPRKTDDDLNEDSLQELQARRADKSTGVIDEADEFTCARCFLVHHRSQLAEERNGSFICRECAA